jgi:isoleucyl-tRNA synthetase
MIKIHFHPQPKDLLPPFLSRIMWDLPQPALPRLTNENYLEVAEVANAYLQQVFQEQARAAKLAEYQATQKQEKLARQLATAQETLLASRNEVRELIESQQAQAQANATLEATLQRAQTALRYEQNARQAESHKLEEKVQALNRIIAKQQQQLNQFLDMER